MPRGVFWPPRPKARLFYVFKNTVYYHKKVEGLFSKIKDNRSEVGTGLDNVRSQLWVIAVFFGSFPILYFLVSNLVKHGTIRVHTSSVEHWTPYKQHAPPGNLGKLPSLPRSHGSIGDPLEIAEPTLKNREFLFRRTDYLWKEID